MELAPFRLTFLPIDIVIQTLRYEKCMRYRSGKAALISCGATSSYESKDPSVAVLSAFI